MLAAVLGLSLALTAPAEPTKPPDPLAVRIAAERHRITHHLPEAPRMPPRTPTVFASLAREHSRHLAARSAYDIQESLLHTAARADDELAFHRERIAELDARIAATTSASYRVQLAQRRTDLQADVARASAELAKHLESLASPGSNSRYREESLYLLVDTLARQDAPSLLDVHRRLTAEFPRSRFLPHADILLAHTTLARRQPRTARRLCEGVLAGPASELHGNAALVLGWSYMRSEAGEGPEPALAMAAFTRAIEISLVGSILDDHETLRRSARSGLVLAFAAAASVDKAAAEFQRLGDTPGAHHSDEMLEHLALSYFARGQHDRSAAIYRVLQALHQGAPQSCIWQVRLLLTTVAARDREAQARETGRLAELSQRWITGKLHLKSERQHCSDAVRDAEAALTH